MAVTKRTTKNGRQRWAVRWREGGREREKWFDRRTDALDFDAQVTLAKRRRQPMYDDRVTVAQLADLYESTHLPTLAPRTQTSRNAQLSRRIRPDLGGYRVMELDTLALTDYLTNLSKAGVGPATINQTRATLSGMYGLAIKARLVHGNPVTDTPKWREVARLPHALTLDEIFHLADAMRYARDRCLVIVAALAGPRLSEALALHWRDVRDDNLRIEWTLDEDRSLKPPKDYERRSIPLFDLTRDALAEWRSDAPDTQLVFPNTVGRPIHEGNWRRREWHAATRRAGLDGMKPGDLRDTFASILISEGASVPYVQRKMGHSKPSLTLDTYGQWFADRDDGMFERMNTRLNTLRSP
jgi:integrase